MFTLFSLITVYFFTNTKKNVSVYLLLYGFCFFTFSVVLDGNFFGWWDHLYVHDYVETSILNLYYWFVIFLSFTVFFVLLSNKKNKISISPQGAINFYQLKIIARFIALISLIATVKNLLGAGNPLMLFTDARAWEFAFGRNVIFNYLYFLHVFALVLFGVVIGWSKGSKLDKMLVILLLFSSFLHGIKFTILHAFLFFIFAYLLATGEVISNKIKILAGILFSVLVSFFLFARGGGVEGFLAYILSASVNSLYFINNLEFYNISSLSIFNPLSFLPTEKLNRLFSVPISTDMSTAGFILNDKYNLEHVITIVGFAFGTGLLIYTVIFAFLINYLRASMPTEFHKVFFLVMIMNTLLLFFTAFDFYKTKLWFNLFIALFFYYFLVFFNQLKFSKLRRIECE